MGDTNLIRDINDWEFAGEPCGGGFGDQMTTCPRGPHILPNGTSAFHDGDMM